MFDGVLRKLIDPSLNIAGKKLAQRGLSANAITVVGFAVGCCAWAALALEQYTIALLLIAINRLADGLDGALARQQPLSDLGGYLDILLDFIFFAGVPFFFAVGKPLAALPAAFLIFSFMGTGSSFLAFAVMAAKRGLETSARGKKSIYYLGGLAEGSETIALFVLICLLPNWFGPLAWGYGIICWITTLSRISIAIQTIKNAPAVDLKKTASEPPLR